MLFPCMFHSSIHTNTYIYLFIVIDNNREREFKENMAACGGLEQIFEKPFSETTTFLESLSPWKHIKSNESSSFNEIFRESHFKENRLELAPPAEEADQERGKGCSTSSSSYNPYNERKQYRSNDSFSLCTEGLGFESSEDVEHDLCDEEWRNQDGGGERERDQEEGEERSLARSSYVETHRSEAEVANRGALPPPISCIGRCGKPWVYFKSFREDGRFILKEIRIPTQEFLHACRQDGRLKLHFIQSDDDDEDDDEEEDEEGVEEKEQDMNQYEQHVESRDSKS